MMCDETGPKSNTNQTVEGEAYNHNAEKGTGSRATTGHMSKFTVNQNQVKTKKVSKDG